MRLAVLTMLLGGLVATSAQADKPLRKAGQLICTLAHGPSDEKSSLRAMRCRFQPVAGAGAVYIGSIEQVSGVPLTKGKRVLIWLVMAPEISISPTTLAGRYLSRPRKGAGASATRLGTMFRDALYPVELRLEKSGLGEAAGRTAIVELRLRAAKT